MKASVLAILLCWTAGAWAQVVSPPVSLSTPARPGNPEARTPTSGVVANVSKEAPFENALGMKFVPVAITGGPTGGQIVYFSIWDTRVQDYEVFLAESKRNRSTPDFEQEATHPVVMVNWDDSQAFCSWLTERERKSGRMDGSHVYRLPSDHEWSCAVGIGGQEDARQLPVEKSGKIAGVFPWGAQWPPLERVGNYGSEELRLLQEAGKYPRGGGVIPGYKDGYAFTSPVGSYAANRLGLYDLGGNVFQWCEDWFDKNQNKHVLRGECWHDGDRVRMLSSYRQSSGTGRFATYGFRCVIGVAPR